VRLWNDGYLLGIGWKEAPFGSGGGGPCGEPAGPFGLISGHAYGILGLYKSKCAPDHTDHTLTIEAF
jgi:hypothetical protein